MFFNSLTFAVFLPIVFILYWFVFKRHLKAQNIFLLIVSYVFYGWWDYRFLSLILLSTLIDFYIGSALKKEESSKKRKWLLATSLLFNLGVLGFFKYANFFIESWVDAWSILGVQMHTSTLQIILPVGISFYTFQTLSYTIDVYRKKMEPTSSFIQFATYVAFFPQLVAGPIERASHLLPQFKKPRVFDFETAKSGLHLIIWGLFQKIVIADSCATYVNAIFNNYEGMNSLSLLLGAVYFALQIYGDFAGYSNIAIGVARLLGFDLMRNFNYPYFSRDIAEFWRRWHISLSTWFRDYLYIPLGGSRGSKRQQIRNVFIIFIVSGFWHGANWTFVVWGALNAFYFLPVLLLKQNRKNLDVAGKGTLVSTGKEMIQIIITFALTCIAWIFFRSASIKDSFYYLERMFTNLEFKKQYLNIERHSIEMVLLIAGFLFVEWLWREKETPLSGKFDMIKVITTILLIIVLGVFSEHQSFIYFQF
ncbi:MBOAT family O-acyltransferase [Dokdonia ponticola]|uniref:MBOAT family O-acyltransferase n=1 Tax=Dokdonia ponticola TaxID=2041041 RepID=A0ABV9I298_9FLAO